MADPPLECVAYHEAGHAAMHFVMGRKFRFVTIEPTPENLGACHGFNSPPRFRPDIELTPVGERYIRDAIDRRGDTQPLAGRSVSRTWRA